MNTEQLVTSIANDVQALENRTIRAVLPALRHARDELRRDLARWLAEHPDGAERFTAQQFRRALLSVEQALISIGRMREDLETQLGAATRGGATLAASHLRDELSFFSRTFGQSIRPTQISTAAIMARAKGEIIPRIKTSAARYVGAVREDIRKQFAIGLASGETFEQLTNRLRRLGGPRGLVALRGIAGEPGAHVEEIAEGLFNRYRHWAERVVRTEVMNAYNVEHLAGIKELNADLKDDDQELLQLKWDSTPDKRRCPLCAELDGLVRKVGREFKSGIKTAPAHPCCRCVVVAWHPSWGDEAPGVSRSGRDDKTAEPPSATAGSAGMSKTNAELSRSREVHEAQAAIDQETARPMATRAHANASDPNGIATPERRAALEHELQEVFGRPITYEELTHGFAVPDGYEARLSGLMPTQVEWTIHDRKTGAKVGDLVRDFYPRIGAPTMHHALLDLDSAHRGAGISDTINGNALRHYEKWGVQRVDVSAAWAGRYAWARLGFSFDRPERIVEDFERYIDRHRSLRSRRDELVTVVRGLAAEPWKLAALGVRDAKGKEILLPDEYNQGGKSKLKLGKAFLLSREVGIWDGHLVVDRNNDGYRNAIAKAAVARKTK